MCEKLIEMINRLKHCSADNFTIEEIYIISMWMNIMQNCPSSHSFTCSEFDVEQVLQIYNKLATKGVI